MNTSIETDAPCARPGCGAPKAWHTNKNTIEDLSLWCRRLNHLVVTTIRPEGWCLGNNCACTGYLAPEPPHPKPYVVMMQPDLVREFDGRYYTISGAPIISLADYLASPTRLTCDCGHLSLDHYEGEPRECQTCACFRFEESHPQPAPVRECIISDCPNTSDQGIFVGDLCAPCCVYLRPWGRWQLKDGPQPAPRMCICGGREDEHNPVTGRCEHVAKWVGPLDTQMFSRCSCRRFREAQP